jgi:hypothetical protein
MRHAGHIALRGEEKCIQAFCVEKQNKNDNLEDIDVDGKIILK